MTPVRFSSSFSSKKIKTRTFSNPIQRAEPRKCKKQSTIAAQNRRPDPSRTAHVVLPLSSRRVLISAIHSLLPRSDDPPSQSVGISTSWSLQPYGKKEGFECRI
uniref:Uncharacterized protein n=1 Tax=Solanum tuberosum TaxID=4113 RepID=M1BES6_SOLTU